MINRRTFLAAAATLAAAPRTVLSQAARLPRVALIGVQPLNEITEDSHPSWSTLIGELRRLGQIDGQTVAIEAWSRLGLRDDQRVQFVSQVVATNPDIVMVTGGGWITSFAAATSVIPIVGIGTFPPEFNANLARPGENVTGFDFTSGGAVYGKALQHLHNAVPTISRVGYFGPQINWESPASGGAVRAAADALHLTLVPVFFDRPVDEAGIRAAFSTINDQKFDAIYIPSNSSVRLHRRTVVELVTNAQLPSISTHRELSEAGLLMSFDTNRLDLFRGAAGYVDRILKGADPGELPIQQPTVFDFVVNLKAARALGITLPLKTLYAATEVIE